MVQVVPSSDDPVGRTPVRICVGCRRRTEQTALLRVVAADHTEAPPGWSVVPDPRRRQPGRGASVHLTPECVTAAIQRGAFGRALKRSGRPDTTALEALLGQQD
ncbi:YlxR family protein [Ornithinimicrobium ciconiae]|uniref:YlxR family protein n=1 Tax=Ornithinimicrobium ciconiae TaxID=2594265 RepID=A0A516GC85_9MICO|nr:YlxR family protein [Ornithinimicrobium ciconiae]QDO89097.1 YlxR family protein [Ornithinimicrobium ciconiae]